MIVYPLPDGDIIWTYEGEAWVVICGITAIGPFDGERSLAFTWLLNHCPMGEPEDDGIPRQRCHDKLLWLEHRILALEGWK